MSDIDLRKLAEPFPGGDVKWRIVDVGPTDNGAYCVVVPYVTGRAIYARLDEVCGPENWCSTSQQISTVDTGVVSIQVGISIRWAGEWIVKYGVSSPTQIEPAKGAHSGAVKRAGVAWGIARYLEHMPKRIYADLSRTKLDGYEFDRRLEKLGLGIKFWKPPRLPAWALPKVSEEDKPITVAQINQLKKSWRGKFAPTEKSRQALAEGFTTFVEAVIGEFSAIDDTACWTQKMIDDCQARIDATKDGGAGPSADVPFA